jgi:hypothetical protein
VCSLLLVLLDLFNSLCARPRFAARQSRKQSGSSARCLLVLAWELRLYPAAIVAPPLLRTLRLVSVEETGTSDVHCAN